MGLIMHASNWTWHLLSITHGYMRIKNLYLSTLCISVISTKHISSLYICILHFNIFILSVGKCLHCRINFGPAKSDSFTNTIFNVKNSFLKGLLSQVNFQLSGNFFSEKVRKLFESVTFLKIKTLKKQNNYETQSGERPLFHSLLTCQTRIISLPPCFAVNGDRWHIDSGKLLWAIWGLILFNM